MTIAVGQILDKYQILEQVGQGGMAVVYRGLDRALDRHVAVKVLHRHLAGHAEARERFAREARAVAKLRHENILEIYDFADEGASESYIVAELIDGPTLTELAADHPPRYPEIGAMIAVQVCRALAHAHSLGILHRDVKPENIMISGDGLVKLTDFGIAQMLDMQRMTVTGQLLGSPAYMSPEHIEGKPLDFRTDIFALGVVLYQVVVGELPFRGRNPHELLKRIAEGVYRDPRQANPLVGNELGRIIDKALARSKEDRYPDITEMLVALERYLENSGITDCRDELRRYFTAPVSYELALRERLLAALIRRGRELLSADQVVALDLFNRALTIDPENREVIELIDRLSRKRRALRLGLLFGGVLVLLALAYGGKLMWSNDGTRPAPATSASTPRAAAPPRSSGADVGTAPSRSPAPVETALADAAGAPLALAADAGAADTVKTAAPSQEPDDRRPAPAVVHRLPPGEQDVPVRPGRNSGADAGAAGPRQFTLNVSPFKSEYRIDSGPWQSIARGRATIEVAAGPHVVEVRNTACCESDERLIPADASGGGTLEFTLGYLPATITPKCSLPGVGVQIDGKPARLDHRHTVFFTRSFGQRTVTVTFFNAQTTDEHVVQVRYSEAKVVTCELR